MKLAVALCFAAGSALVQEFIPTDGPLSDTDFYRIVSCGAPPGGVCQKNIVRWSATDANEISVGISVIDDGYPTRLAASATKALESSIVEVNKSGANLKLIRSYHSEDMDIAIHLKTIRSGEAIQGTGRRPPDGLVIEAAWTQLWWRSDLTLVDGIIVFPMNISRQDLPSVMLEEVTQALGLLTDIGGDHYETRSIFSQSSNQLTSLGPQDIMALRQHYP